MGDLIRDTFALAIRRPLVVFVLPALIMIGAELLASLLLYGEPALEVDWEDSWISLRRVLGMPLIGLCWVGVAWDRKLERVDTLERTLRIGGGAFCGMLLGLAFLVLTEWTYIGGVALVALFAPLVPIAVAESGGVGRAIARNFTLGNGSRGRVLVTWLLLGGMLAFLGLVGALALMQARADDEVVVVALQVYAALRWGLTMALSVAVYRRLRSSRMALDVDEWVEVFE